MTGSAETLRDRNISLDRHLHRLKASPPEQLLRIHDVGRTTYAANPFTMADAGVKMVVPPKRSSGDIASLNLTIGGSFGEGGGVYGVWNRGDQSLREIATLTKGKHVLQFGGEAVRLTQPMANTFQEGGTFQFTNNLTGNNIADFELGVVSNFIQGGGLYLNFTGINWSAFIQDDWKVVPRLTLSTRHALGSLDTIQGQPGPGSMLRARSGEIAALS